MLGSLRRQQGTSLVELMVSMSIGFVSLTAMASLVGHGIGLNAQLMAKSRLYEEVNGIAHLLQSEIKRHGYYADMSKVILAPNEQANPFKALLAVSQYRDEAGQSCILFAYDRNNNGQLDTDDGNEHFGFRLKDQAIEIRIDGLDCDSPGWHDLSDPQVVKITELSFNLRPIVLDGITVYQVSLMLRAELTVDSVISQQISHSFYLRNYG